ncbi:MAG TPA: hypothetical protein VFO55_00205 [Gemmatimonadaceae bacterium]|nr:hypothetical protein [Gemmatimonadaceae bacterium]
MIALQRLRLLTLATAAASVAACAAPAVIPASPAQGTLVAPAAVQSAESTYGKAFLSLSEPAGYFPSENVVSNETSYLHVLDAMRRIGVKGGAYIGVGPDQNFSYIAAIRPDVAYMFDIRRDAMIEHQLFKAVFSMSRNRLEYLCVLLAKPVPADVVAWKDRPIGDIIDYVDRTPASVEIAKTSEREIERRAASFGIPLTEDDIAVLAMYRAAFIRFGLDVQYSSLNGNMMGSMPVWRDLLVEVDRSGNQLNYLAADSLFQYVKQMQAANRIIPVTGNAAGPTALRRLGDEIRSRGLVVSALYMSNVEQYLMRDGGFASFAANVKTLPRDAKSVMIRSVFASGRGGAGWHPMSVPGYNSTQLLQFMDTFVTEVDAGRIRTYNQLLDHGHVPP